MFVSIQEILSEIVLGKNNVQIIPHNVALAYTAYKLKIITPIEIMIIPTILFFVKDSFRIRYANIGIQI